VSTALSEAEIAESAPEVSAVRGTTRAQVTALASLKAAAAAGDEAATNRQYQLGKLTARERIDLLVDPDSFGGLALRGGHGAY